MKPSNPRRLYFWLLASWLTLTIGLTSIPNPAFRIDVNHADKKAHFAFYGIIGTLYALWRRESGDSPVKSVLGAVLFTAVFGAFDEVHQRFIPGRSMELLDWTADLVGGIAGSGAVMIASVLNSVGSGSDD